MPNLTRRRLLCATAPLAAAPLGLAIARSGDAGAAAHDHSKHRSPASHNRSASMGHAAMIGEGAPFMLTGQWWLVAGPGLALSVTVWAFLAAGDRLRDRLDPRRSRGLGPRGGQPSVPAGVPSVALPSTKLWYSCRRSCS